MENRFTLWEIGEASVSLVFFLGAKVTGIKGHCLGYKKTKFILVLICKVMI